MPRFLVLGALWLLTLAPIVWVLLVSGMLTRWPWPWRIAASVAPLALAVHVGCIVRDVLSARAPHTEWYLELLLSAVPASAWLLGLTALRRRWRGRTAY
ncbi:MAG: hypothetical protein MUF40_03670 [Gemmatimonadaceae bacterium]|jgi:hypothetical protein|nr:hypothetical protein [Gemmatimonadaceae bacterium]